MGDKTTAQWAFIFEQLGKDDLRQMLFKAAVHKDEEGRTVVEFRGEKAMNVTDHVEEMENELQ